MKKILLAALFAISVLGLSQQTASAKWVGVPRPLFEAKPELDPERSHTWGKLYHYHQAMTFLRKFAEATRYPLSAEPSVPPVSPLAPFFIPIPGPGPLAPFLKTANS